MRHFHLQRNHEWKPILNIDKLITLIPEEHREKYTNAASDTAPVLNLLDRGYAKLLGKGRITFPVVIRARYVSFEAEKKIIDAGGVIKLVT
jgi:large subunit ribosomal protein L27Ae